MHAASTDRRQATQPQQPDPRPDPALVRELIDLMLRITLRRSPQRSAGVTLPPVVNDRVEIEVK